VGLCESDIILKKRKKKLDVGSNAREEKKKYGKGQEKFNNLEKYKESGDLKHRVIW